MNNETIGSGPIEPQYLTTMQVLGQAIDEIINGPKGAPRNNGFLLMLFPFTNDGPVTEGRCNYLSNAHREDVIVLLREQLAYFEGMPEITLGGQA